MPRRNASRPAKKPTGQNLPASLRAEHRRLMEDDDTEQLPADVDDDQADDAGEQPANQTVAAAPARGAAARSGQALAGVIVGLFLWGFAENAITGGISQGTGWLRAKFLNEPYGSTGAADTAATLPKAD